MHRQFEHRQLPRPNAEERSRQDFVQSLKLHLATKVVQGNKAIYQSHVEPAFERRTGRKPADRQEVRALMEREPFYRLWGSMQRCSQEMLWTSVGESVMRQLPALSETAASWKEPKGSLELNPSLEAPAYLTAIDIHCMPGSYHTERFAGDVGQGAIYDRGVHVYAMGGSGPCNDALGRGTASFVGRRFPGLRPRRILELGCGVGHNLVPYADAYPEAEIHGVDIGAPMLRYGHSRAEAMGKTVHFKQMNAERTGYPDASFDLIVSHILLHETSGHAIRAIMRECHRLLAPTGVMAHAEMCMFDKMAPFDAFMLDWDSRHNNEPFWGTYRSMDWRELLAEAGFRDEAMFETLVSRAFAGQAVFTQDRDSAGRGTWQIFGARK